MLEVTIVFCSVLVIYFDHHKKVEKLDYNIIFGSIENDLVRISHYSYLDESASLLFKRSLESTEFCLCFKGLPLLGSSKSCTAVSTEPWHRVCWKKFHLLTESRVILFLYNYIKIRDTDFWHLLETWLWWTKTSWDSSVWFWHDINLQIHLSCMLLSALSSWIWSQSLDLSSQYVLYLKGDRVSTMENMFYWCIKLYFNVS